MENSTKYYSNIQEKCIANELGWHQVSGSGSRNLHPGDVVSPEWLGECKTHTKPNQKIIFDFGVWSKIVDEASSRYKYPILFCDDGSQKLDNTWCMFSVLPPTSEYVTILHPIDGSSLRFNHTEMINFISDKGISMSTPVLIRLISSDSRVNGVYLSRFHDFERLFFGDV